MIGIIDYGAGNIQSVINATEFLGQKAVLINNANDLAKFDKLILPGVGAFGEAMVRLKSSNLDKAICEFVAKDKPFLGICLGMQLLFEKSYEFGEHEGLGILKGSVVKFDENRFNKQLKIPHIGWNSCKFTKQTPINIGLHEESYLYFVHSFHIVCNDEISLAKTTYGYEFTSAVAKNNIFGFQPHPEKSHENGLKILKNFMEL